MERRHPSLLPGAACLLALALCVGAEGCAHNPAPRRWLPSARVAAESTAFGGWLELKLRGDVQGSSSREIEGEFLAIGPDSSIRLLTVDGVYAVSFLQIERARLTGYDVEQTVGLFTFPGVVLTAANGWALFLTAPVWLLAGMATTWEVWGRAKVNVPPRSWNDLRVYARYPAGWPPDLDPALIRPDARWPAIARLREVRDQLEKETP